MISYVDALLTSLLLRFTDEDRGQGMVEYGLILFLVSIAALIALTALGGQISQIFTDIGNALGA